MKPAVACVFLPIVLSTAVAGGADEPPDPGIETEEVTATTDGESPANEPWRERIAVTAEVKGADAGPPGSTSTVLDPEVGTIEPTSVTDLVAFLPGVSENGQGGLFQGFSIRGVARQRVMSLVSGMRITSERRAGATVTFVDPLLMRSVEVLQGPSSTFHGSGALGGVVQVLPRRFEDASFHVGYTSNDDETHQVFGTGGKGWSVGLARRDAGDAESADGTTLNSHFTQYSGVARFDWGKGPRSYELLFIPSYGDEIGKANSDFPGRTTEYPAERHLMLKFGIVSDTGWRTHAYVHSHALETRVVAGDGLDRVENESTDYGLRFENDRTLSRRASLRWGVEAIGRADVDATENSDDTADTDPPTRTVSLNGAEALEAGGFASIEWDWTRTRLEAGTRLSRSEQENLDRSVDDTTISGFAGATRDLGRNVLLGASVSSGTRFPSLSELFFTGTTGRGEVIGNPDLESEQSLNAEASIRWTGKSLLLKGVVFHNEIDDYIGRIEIAEDLRTFVNLTSGTIEGIELHGLALPSDGWMVNFGGHLLEGRDDDDKPLDDVAADELFAGADHRIGDWSIDARWTHRFEKSDPGDDERIAPAADLISAGVTWRAAPRWTVAISGSNLLDEKYFRSADRKSSPAPGRSWAVRLTWRGNGSTRGLE